MSGADSQAVTSVGSAREWIACESCDLLVSAPELRVHERADCPRCGQLLERSRPDSIRRTLALAVGALLLYVVAQSATIRQEKVPKFCWPEITRSSNGYLPASGFEVFGWIGVDPSWYHARLTYANVARWRRSM